MSQGSDSENESAQAAGGLFLTRKLVPTSLAYSPVRSPVHVKTG